MAERACTQSENEMLALGKTPKVRKQQGWQKRYSTWCHYLQALVSHCWPGTNANG